MKELRINRRQVLKGVGAIGVIGALGVPKAVFAEEEDEGGGTVVRWDIVSIDFVKGTISAGGHASATANDGSTITLTGSGTFRLGDDHNVTGGGTWTATGDPSIAGSGTYEVKGFVSFIPAPGGAPPLTDLIGNSADASAGLAFLRIRFSNGMPGVLTVSCALPGNPTATPPTPPAPATIFEGIRVSMGYVDFWNGTKPVPGVDGNRTEFHITRASEEGD